MKFIGITGGVGAGKSEILNFIRQRYAARIVLADDLAKELMAPGGVCYDALREAFEEDGVFAEDGTMDQRRMAAVLFSDEKKREKMNGIVHPAVKREVLRQVELETSRGVYAYFFLEAALLIEENYDEICDELWYIYTSEEKRRERLMKNRGYSGERVDSMMASQLPEHMFRQRCGVVIDNNGTTEEACRQVMEILDGTV